MVWIQADIDSKLLHVAWMFCGICSELKGWRNALTSSCETSSARLSFAVMTRLVGVTFPNVMLSSSHQERNTSAWARKQGEPVTQLTTLRVSNFIMIHCFAVGNCCAPLHLLDGSCGVSTSMF